MAKSKPKKPKQIPNSKTTTQKIAKYVEKEQYHPIVCACVTQKINNQLYPQKNLSDFEQIKKILYDIRSPKSSYDYGIEKFLGCLNSTDSSKIEKININKNLLKLLEILKGKRVHKLLEDDNMLQSLLMISRKIGYAIRPLDTWKRKSHSSTKQFRSIIDHLFVKYKVPECLYDAWHFDTYNAYTEKHVNWFLALTEGQSVRTLKDFPIKITPKMAHYFMNSPNYMTINGAIRYAQVMAYGGDEYLAWYINESSIGRNGFLYEEFWESVIAFFARTPMFDAEKIPELVDYLGSQHQDNPDFSMKGRTINALLRQSEEWHAELAQRRKASLFLKNMFWLPSHINTFVKEEGNIEHNSYRKFVIRELLSSDELKKEGNAMHHCVASYGYKCEKRTTAIFTLEELTYWNHINEKMVTIEIDLKNNQVVQIKGKYNRQANQREKNIIGLWLEANAIRKSKWID